jgi:iron-sulfur cluster repair protein YtfE (RIC family)
MTYLSGDFGSAPVSSSGSAEEARAAIFSQHETIRMLLRAAGTVADMAAGGSRRVGDLLPHYLESVRAALEQHLAFEERLLLPILAADPPLGPERAQRLRDEHRRQRAELASLSRARDESQVAPVRVAERLRALVDEFLADMTAEEELLLAPAVLRDDLVSVDQECG